MDMPPSGWYPDPYGVPGLLRWWDGSTWTQHTHEGSSADFSDPSGPATMLDGTRIGSPSAAAGGAEPRTAIERAAPRPTTVQPAIRPGDAMMAAPTTIQPSVPGTAPAGGRVPAGQSDYGTQVLPVGDAGWGAPGGPGDYDSRVSRFGRHRDQRRRRMLLGGLLAGGTAVALALIALLVNGLGSAAPPASTVAQQTPPATTAAAAATPPQSATPAPASPVTTVPGGVSDSVSGLSYSLLSSPWANGCPPSLSNQQTLTWTAGEQATAGQFSSNNQQVTWYGEACSGPLPQQYGYNGVADLEPMAMNLVNQFDGPYYGGLNHQRTQLASTPVSISGHPGWEVKYLETYPDAASMGLPFNSEEGAVVVTDQGTGLPPAVFFVSVPSNLGVANVDSFIGSLKLTVTQQPSGQATTTQPTATQSAGNGGGNGNGNGGGGGGNP